MIDWKKERATKNYCGYCTDSPTGSVCCGSCFNGSNKEKNRVDHILEMLKIIPQQIQELEKKQQEYKDSLNA